MSNSTAAKVGGRRTATSRRRGEGGRLSESLRAAIVEADYLNQISSRPGRLGGDLTNGTRGGVLVR